MGYIAELKTVAIEYTTYVNRKEFSVTKFDTLKLLRDYFHEHKREGEVVGYVVVKNRTPGFNDHILTGKLAIEWTDKTGYTKKGFDNVFQMIDFLKEYKVLGDAVGYNFQDPELNKSR